MSENNKKKILVLDDESPVAEMIAEFCESIGFESKVLTSGEHMMDVVKSYSPDLITLDLVMPDISGLEILEELKQDPETKSIPVVVISALAGGNSAEDILELSQGILTKPIHISSLKEKIDHILSAA